MKTKMLDARMSEFSKHVNSVHISLFSIQKGNLRSINRVLQAALVLFSLLLFGMILGLLSLQN